MKKVFICSPYRPTGQNPEAERKRNVERAQTACRLAIDAGYLPLAPHLYFTQMLNDDQLFERFIGMAYGSLWLDEADEMWVIGTDLSEGMKQELEYARKKNIPVKMKKNLKQMVIKTPENLAM